MDAERELLKGNTPTLVLAVLRDGPLHGYAIAREIQRRSANALRCKEGTLYPALHALERDELIQGEWRRPETGHGPERKVYSLSPAGHAALAERTRTWERFAAAVHRVIAGDADENPHESLGPGRAGAGRFPAPEPAG